MQQPVADIMALIEERLLRRAEVERITALGTSTLYRRVREGSFPAPVQIGGGAVRWRQTEVSAWLAQLRPPAVAFAPMAPTMDVQVARRRRGRPPKAA
ncbi:AlpA family phage regulatory protein [Roseomonas gilardii]|uniref:AlpA family phage regulatory protein n=1 Tax=Roseomonas gilardii TaxID=257708 RepID=A0ABU3MBA6_9PROT|nr:AlpA family phage regulatory protein [Roseomonas gilardii]MDT8330172.1 AlpA family phage regulatory protein [Roseomonas gilardii]